ncbi:hypothetical protein [Aestuariivirga sp.]|uniref:hypothetical protein n=1 Tax=Aestuariivirga sp. TaxID=2650926 RepID=UPI003BADA5C6
MTVSAAPRVSRFLALAGGAALIVAAAWWAIVFGRIIANGYLPAGQSVYCSVSSSIICDLAMSLCGSSHPLGIKWFSPAVTWLALALLSAAALLPRGWGGKSDGV